MKRLKLILFLKIKKKIFEGLAQETLSMCIQSLTKAADGIKKNKVFLNFLALIIRLIFY